MLRNIIFDGLLLAVEVEINEGKIFVFLKFYLQLKH